MDDKLQQILALAWRTVPATEANEAIARARQVTGQAERAERAHILDADNEVTDPGLNEGPWARAYELVLQDEATFESFARDQLPKLVYHLESVGAHLPHARGVVLCVFAGQTLHFLHAAEALEEICGLLAVTSAELVARYGTGEVRTAVALHPKALLPPMALPPPDDKN